MKHVITIVFSLILNTVLLSQVEIDRPITLTGGPGQSKISGLEDAPTQDSDAANKKYVDDQISGVSGGSGHYVGELFGGGVVYMIYKDSNGDEHGLIVSLIENNTGTAWSNVTGSTVGTTNSLNGAANTIAIMSQGGHSASAAKICDDYTGGGNTDWFLPAITQLDMLWNNIYVVSLTLASTGGAELLADGGFYWSSTEDDGSNARRQIFDYGTLGSSDKSSARRARCVRAF